MWNDTIMKQCEKFRMGDSLQDNWPSLFQRSMSWEGQGRTTLNFPVHLNMFSIENLKNIFLSIIKITLSHASSIPLTLSLLCHSCLVKSQLWLNPVLGLLCALHLAVEWRWETASQLHLQPHPTPPTHCWLVSVTFRWALSAASKSTTFP